MSCSVTERYPVHAPQLVNRNGRFVASVAAMALSALSLAPAFALDAPTLGARYHNYVLCAAYAVRLGAYMEKIGNSKGVSVAGNAKDGFESHARALALAAGQNTEIVGKDLASVQQSMDAKLQSLSESEQNAFSGELDDFCTSAMTQGSMPDIAFEPLGNM